MSFDARINCQYKFGKKMRNAALNFKMTSDRRDFFKTSSLGAFALSTGLSSFSPPPTRAACVGRQIVANSPYGVCAHIGAGEEWEQAPEFAPDEKAGIVWVRADFSWIGVERSQGNWTFGHLDKIVDETNKLGLQLLPILDYGVPALLHTSISILGLNMLRVLSNATKTVFNTGKFGTNRIFKVSGAIRQTGRITPSCSKRPARRSKRSILILSSSTAVLREFLLTSLPNRSTQEPEIPLTSSTSILIAAGSQRVNASINSLTTLTHSVEN